MCGVRTDDDVAVTVRGFLHLHTAVTKLRRRVAASDADLAAAAAPRSQAQGTRPEPAHKAAAAPLPPPPTGAGAEGRRGRAGGGGGGGGGRHLTVALAALPREELGALERRLSGRLSLVRAAFYEALELETQCPVCMACPKTIVFGCGHQVCADCAPRVADCPVCRVPIVERIRRY